MGAAHSQPDDPSVALAEEDERSLAVVATVDAEGRLVLPPEARAAAGIVPGRVAAFDMVSTPDRVLFRRIAIDPDQARFWTPEWQEGERDADRQIAEGRTTVHESSEAFLASAEARSNPANR